LVSAGVSLPIVLAATVLVALGFLAAVFLTVALFTSAVLAATGFLTVVIRTVDGFFAAVARGFLATGLLSWPEFSGVFCSMIPI
jgi:hypothetical protein